MGTTRLIGTTLAAAMVLAGCSGDPSTEPSEIPTVVASLTADPTPSPTGASPSPATTPTPTPTPSATPLTPPPSTGAPVGTAAAILTQELAGLEHPKSGGSCPVGEAGGSTIVDCAAVEAPGGDVAVIVEELPDTRHIATMLRYDEPTDHWFPVKFSEHYGFPVPNSPWVSITVRPVQNLFVGDMIVVEGLVGGSGAVTAFDVVGWPDGDPAPSVIAPFPAAGHVGLAIAAGAARQTIANYSDGAPNCCPNLHDLRIVNLTTGQGRLWEALPTDAVSPIVAAFELYHHWILGDQAGAVEWATNDVIDDLWPAPTFDVHQLLDTQCVPMPEAFQCSFQNEAGIRHFLVAPGGVNGYEVVELVNLAD